MAGALKERKLASAALLLLHMFVVGLAPLADATFGAPPASAVVGIPSDGSSDSGPGHDASHENCQFARLLSSGSILGVGVHRIEPAPISIHRLPAPDHAAVIPAPRRSPLGSRAPPSV